MSKSLLLYSNFGEFYRDSTNIQRNSLTKGHFTSYKVDSKDLISAGHKWDSSEGWTPNTIRTQQEAKGLTRSLEKAMKIFVWKKILQWLDTCMQTPMGHYAKTSRLLLCLGK
jgi:hypothetical protein